MRINGTSVFSAVKLAEGQKVPREVQVLRTGKFNHPQYGFFVVTNQTLAEMKANFDKRIRGIDMSFDYFHQSDEEASAWVTSLELRENGTELWAVNVDWTPKAERMLAEKEIRYFSPDFAFQWKDPEHGVVHNNVLFGGGLTNRPFVKEMKAIVADETQGENMTELEKAQKQIEDQKAQIIKLSEDVKSAEQKLADAPPADKVSQLEQQIAALQAELQKAKQEKEVMAAEKAKSDEAAKAAQEQKALAEKESKFNVLLSEGKACVAQKDAFMKGDMDAFIKLAEPTNLKGAGSSNSGDTTQTADVQAIMELAEAKQKENPKLSLGDAISIAKKELKK